jgi:hypothetical protein
MHMVAVLLILFTAIAFYGIVVCLLVGLCRDSARGDATLAAYGRSHASR